MQPAGSGGSGSAAGGGGGGSELSRGPGLTRFRSAPATWLEALLEPETIHDDLFLSSSPLLPTRKPPPHPNSEPLSSNLVNSTQPRQHPKAEENYGRYEDDEELFESPGGGGGSGLTNFIRQNSSPAEFLSQINSDGYFSSFGISSNFDYVSPSSVDVASQPAKRSREDDADSPSAKLSSQRKGEQSGQLCGSGGSMDAELEKLMDDLVPCRVRAKRGCATHPRSIAERVRRTRISDRIRKLQELVPNMDKQTNTADMLEEAVEYVKYLQQQIQELTEQQKRCKCNIRE